MSNKNTHKSGIVGLQGKSWSEVAIKGFIGQSWSKMDSSPKQENSTHHSQTPKTTPKKEEK